MNILVKAKTYVILFAILIVGLISACGNPTPAIVPQPDNPPILSDTPASPPVVPSKVPTELPANRVEVVYFHLTQRCKTCLCFEERADYVVKTYFQDELASGKLTFKVCEIGDSKNAATVSKFDAFGSQLFINTIIDNADHIRDIKEIWGWHCPSDKQGFDEKVRSLVEQSLEEVK